MNEVDAVCPDCFDEGDGLFCPNCDRMWCLSCVPDDYRCPDCGGDVMEEVEEGE